MRLLCKALLILVISSTAAIADTTATFILPSGVNVEIIEAPFQKSNFRIDGCLDGNEPCVINGGIPFGAAFGLPKTYVKSIKISYKGRAYFLDVTDMYDAWGSRRLQYEDSLRFGTTRFFGGECDDQSCFLRGIFSDSDGTFAAEWRIGNGKSFRTVLTDSDDVISLFKKHIDSAQN